MRTSRWLLVPLVAACVGLAGAREPSVKLPDIGSSAGEMMSPEQQRDYGASMLHEMRRYNMILDDPQVDDYIQSLGYSLVAYSDRPDLGFTFSTVRESDINAFAAPGGYIFTYVGLITALTSEDQLAGVLAHEISHITQQHLLRAFEDAQKSTLPIALAMLGAMVAARNTRDDTGQAAMVSGLALMQQRMINFTRHDEIEADRVGIQMLARAGYDPHAMAESFGALQRVMRVNGIDVPEFLRTHPVDTNRIADAKARATQLERSYPRHGNDDTALGLLGKGALSPLRGLPASHATPAAATPDTRPSADEAPASRFALMRERARVLNADSANAMVRYYADNLKNDPAFDTLANRYGYALALTRNQQSAKAIDELERLVARQPDALAFQLALAAADDQAGNKSAALKRYERLGGDYPGNRAVNLAYADSLLASGDGGNSRRAQELLRPLLARYGEDPDLQRSFARACELAGDKVRAAEAHAEAAYLNGRAEDALKQLKALAGQSDLDYYQRARVEARVSALTPIVLDLRKRGERTAAQGQSGNRAAPAATWTCLRPSCPGQDAEKGSSRH